MQVRKKRLFGLNFFMKTDTLPRQARDKHTQTSKLMMFCTVALLAAAAKDGGAGGWDTADDLAWQKWNADYLTWLLTSENGAVAARTTNNHHTWLAVETIALALTTNSSSSNTHWSCCGQCGRKS